MGLHVRGRFGPEHAQRQLGVIGANSATDLFSSLMYTFPLPVCTVPYLPGL